MFENLKKLVTLENEEYKARALRRIAESEEACRRYATERRWSQYMNDEITQEELISYTAQRVEREYSKRLEKELEKIAAAEAAPEVEGVTIRVTWKRSATWGYNPHAEVIVNQMNRYTGRASGCGYDKRTAAVGDALNQSAVVMRMLYQAKEKALEAGWTPADASHSNKGCIAYGAGYGALPYFEGGVGMSSFRAVFEACGLRVAVYDESEKHNDYYYFERVEK